MSLDKSPPVFYLWLPTGGRSQSGVPSELGRRARAWALPGCQDFLASYGVGLLSQPVELSTGKLMGSKKTMKKDPRH